MASEVDIYNLALSHFGQDANISSPTEASVDAGHCSRFYPIARDELLEDHAWTWASKRTALAQLVNDRNDYTYRYALPSDCLKPRKLLPEGWTDTENDAAVFEREGDSIYTDEYNATLVYTVKLTNTTKMTPKFITALSWRLAAYIAGPIVKDQTGKTQRNLFERSLLALSSAKTSDANTDRSRSSHTSTAKAAR